MSTLAGGQTHPGLPSQSVYENGPINGNTDAWEINFGFVVSDTFALANNGTTITGGSFGMWLEPGDTLTSAELSITSSENGGTSYFDQTVDFTMGSCTSNQFGYNVCVVNTSFSGPTLNSGTYWVNLQNASVPSGDSVYWDENSGVGCQSPGCPSSASEISLGTIPSESFTLLGSPGNGTTTTLSAPSSGAAGQVVTLAATVVNQDDNLITIGTVTFFNGTQALGTVQANNAVAGVTATLNTRFGPGTYSLTAQYNSNDILLGSVSAAQPLTVTGTEPTISTLTATPNGNNYNFGLSVFGFGAFGTAPLSGSAALNNLTQGGSLLGTIDVAGPGTSTFQPQQTYPVGVGPVGVAVGDFNGDGILDLAVINSNANTVSVLLGNSNGTFGAQATYPVSASPVGIAAWDVNGDGNLDLVVTSSQGVVDVLLGNRDGTFQAPQLYAVGSNPQQVVIADFNEDGVPDLAVTNGGDNTVSVLLGVGNGTFFQQTTFPVGGDPEGIVVGDFNRDGIPDLAVVNHTDGSVSVLLGNGDGSFQAQQTYLIQSGSNPTVIATAGFGGNGITDLVVTTVNSGVAVLLGKGDGTFQPAQTYPAGSLPDGIAIADFNGDGIPDVVVADLINDNIDILLGESNGSLQPPQPYAVGQHPFSVAAADFNGDGVPDVAAVNVLGDTTSILLGGTVAIGQLDDIPVSGVGNQNIQSTFTPNGNFYAGSLSNIVTVVGRGIPTSTLVTSMVNPSNYLQPVTFTATVTSQDGVSPAGTVSFFDNGVSIPGCTGVVLVPQESGSTAPCQDSTLTVGTHCITATYSGSGIFSPSQSPCLNQVVNKANTTVALTSTPNPSSYGQPVSITATVTGAFGGSPTGTVSFTDNGVAIPGCSGVTLNAGVATCRTSTLTVGTHADIVGTYSGDNNYNGSNSTLNPAQVVNKATPVFTNLTTTPSSITYGTASVTVSGTICVAGGACPPSGELV
ncbi:MAG: FG-GAP-like repeat-containing protein, partial [Candidatus Korobacteraceae bacterium]